MHWHWLHPSTHLQISNTYIFPTSINTKILYLYSILDKYEPTRLFQTLKNVFRNPLIKKGYWKKLTVLYSLYLSPLVQSWFWLFSPPGHDVGQIPYKPTGNLIKPYRNPVINALDFGKDLWNGSYVKKLFMWLVYFWLEQIQIGSFISLISPIS